jgi:hypothetical protein
MTMLLKEEIQRIGDAIGLEGRFTFEYGTDHIIEAYKTRSEEIKRAVEMLKIAAKYIRDNDPEGIIFYDGTDCDGYCVADDCETAAECLEGK